MEVRLSVLLRVWLGLLTTLALAAAVWFYAGRMPVQSQSATPVPPFQPSLLPTTTPTIIVPTPTPVSPLTLQFGDESPTWNWQWHETCRPQLEQSIRERSSAQVITFTLVDDPTLALGVAYPALAEAQAVALTGCTPVEDGLTCRVSPSLANDPAALDLALTVAAVYGVEEASHRRVKEEWETQPAWDWHDFEPLIHEEQGTWRSDCLTVSAQ